MSISVAPPPEPAPGAPMAPPNQAEVVIEQRMSQARRHVKGVDLAAALLRLTVGAFLFLLAFAVLDHWLVAGGLGVLGRTFAALLFFAGVGAYAAREILPSCLYRIHPLFAAQALERGRPGVKNSLINFLLLKEHREEVRPVVYDAVQRRAAADLAGIEVEAAIGRTHVFRLGYLLAGVLAAFCLYFVVSPKSPFTSAARLLWPLGRIPAPTRVTIDEITPGNAVVYLGDSIAVTGVVRGLREGEPVSLLFSTADGQLVNQAVPMTLPTGDFRHRAQVPPGGRGFQQSGTYLLAAGDFHSEPFQVDVQTAPAMVVDRVVLEYPGYTGLSPRTLHRQGDLQALEGTRATIYAEGNQPIRRAEIDLGSEGRHTVAMKVNDRSAAGAFSLRLDPNDPTRPQHESYQLRMVDAAGRANPRPVRHRIEVIRDLPPEIALLAPRQQQSQVPADGQLTIRLRAEDPDFGLKRVAMRAVSSGRDLPTPTLLNQSAGETGFRGAFTGEYEFRPAEFSLQPGDRVLYWAEAEDVRQPTPGRAETDRRWIEIVAPTGQPAPERPRPTPGEPGQAQPQPGQTQEQRQPPFDRPEQDSPSAPGQSPEQEPAPDAAPPKPQAADPHGEDRRGESGKQPDGHAGGQAAQGEGQPSGQPEMGQSETGQAETGAAPGQAEASPQGQPDSAEQNTPVNPDANPGDAIERILEHRRQQEGEPPQSPQSPPSGQEPDAADSQPGSGEKSPGDQNQNQNQSQPGRQPPGRQPQPKEQPGDQPAAGAQPRPSGDKPAEQPGQQQQPGQQEQPGQQPGEKPGEKPGEQPGEKPGEKPGDSSGGNPDDVAKPGEKPDDAAEPGAGDQPAGQPKPEPGTVGGSDGDQQATPGQKPAGAEATPDKPQGGPANDMGDQPPGPLQPSPEPGQSDAKRHPGKTDPAREKPSDQPSADSQADADRQPAGTADRSGDPSDQAAQSDQPRPDAEPQDGGTQPEDAMQQQPAGAGQQSPQPSGSPSPQEDNVSRPRPQGQTGGDAAQRQEQSPTISPKQSDAQGDTAGDRSGGGEEGGGQRANQPGVGAPGSQTDAESGAGVSQQPGDGEAGTRPGDQLEADQPTGSSAPRPGGTGQDRGKPGERQPSNAPERPSDTDSPPGQPIDKPQDGGQAGQRVSVGPGARGSGSPTQGGAPDALAADDRNRPAGEPGAEAANLDFARKQTQLALEYLKDQVDKPDSNLLEQLGWSQAEARRFIEQWEQLRRRAGRDDAQGQQARQELDQALRSLGLRPRGTELKRGATATERIDNVRESGRFRPPADWAEQFEAYTRSIAEGER